MTTQPAHNISNERATDLLNDGRPLTNVYVYGDLKIDINENWGKEVVFENCIVENFLAISQQFDKPVKLTNCYFKKCQFTFCYFFGGLIIDNCTFDNYLDFNAGGHNKAGNPVVITNNDFKGFVNFFDCWFENEITISNNKFCKGTNLLGKVYNVPVTFDIEPMIKDNIGQLDLENEGDKID